MELLPLLGAVCLALGSFFLVVGGIGILRLPDVFARMHASGVTDTTGAGFILIGLMFLAPSAPVLIRLLFILFFLWFTSPIGSHSLARAALKAGVRPQVNGEEEH